MLPPARMRSPEEIRSELTTVHRGSPLPWLIVVAVVLGWLATFAMARSRLVDEQQHTADALKGNDEVMARLHTAVSERKKTEMDLEEAKAQNAKLEERIEVLQTQLKTKEEEVTRLKALRSGGSFRR